MGLLSRMQGICRIMSTTKKLYLQVHDVGVLDPSSAPTRASIPNHTQCFLGAIVRHTSTVHPVTPLVRHVLCPISISISIFPPSHDLASTSDSIKSEFDISNNEYALCMHYANTVLPGTIVCTTRHDMHAISIAAGREESGGKEHKRGKAIKLKERKIPLERSYQKL